MKKIRNEMSLNKTTTNTITKKEAQMSPPDSAINFPGLPEKYMLNKCLECDATQDLKKAECNCYFCNDCYHNYEQSGNKCYSCN